MTPIVRTCGICFGSGVQGADACMNCSGTGAATDVESSFEQYEAREPLVEEVIRLSKAYDAITGGFEKYMAYVKAEEALVEACRKLAEWSPNAKQHRSKR